MIDHTLDAANSILHVKPKSALEKADFEALAKTVDPHIAAKGSLRGILIEATKFPGWDSLGAMAAHFRFLKDHHKHIKKLAIVTDAAIANVAEKLGSHFVSAEVKHFPAGQVDAARQWILS